MKFRNGFVSNSSTTSFCIFGVALERKTILEKLGLKNEKRPGCKCTIAHRESCKFCPECGKPAWITNCINDEEIQDCCNQLGFGFLSADGEYYIGQDINGLNSNKKRLSYLQEIADKLETKFQITPLFHYGTYSS